MPKYITAWLILFLFTTSIPASQAQDRPKLAVVLSGGGAKGIAHIPLLKALDSLNVKPDLIIGTSMGSVMGGMYAMGYSADTIEYIVRRLKWDKLLTNTSDYNYLNPSERDEYGKYSLNPGGLTLGYLSPIGPIQFLVSKTNDLDNLRFYFSAGFHFL